MWASTAKFWSWSQQLRRRRFPPSFSRSLSLSKCKARTFAADQRTHEAAMVMIMNQKTVEMINSENHSEIHYRLKVIVKSSDCWTLAIFCLVFLWLQRDFFGNQRPNHRPTSSRSMEATLDMRSISRKPSTAISSPLRLVICMLVWYESLGLMLFCPQCYTKLSQRLMCAQLYIELANILKVSPFLSLFFFFFSPLFMNSHFLLLSL